MSDVIEIWKPIPGFEGLYEVSSLGRIKSLGRWIVRSSKYGNPNKMWFPERIRKPGWHKAGYRLIPLYRGEGAKNFSIHGLVALAFLGPRPDGQQTMHLNGDPADNRLANLQYGTPEENNQAKRQHGTLRFGMTHPCRKITEDDVHRIRAMRGAPQQDIADMFGITFSNVSAIQLRKSWRHV